MFVLIYEFAVGVRVTEYYNYVLTKGVLKLAKEGKYLLEEASEYPL